MENSLSNINSKSNSWKIALAIAIPIAIVPKKAIAIAVSILLLMSDMCCAIRLWAYLVIVLNVKIDNQTEKKVSINTSLLDRVNEILPREEGRGIKWPVSVPNEYYST